MVGSTIGEGKTAHELDFDVSDVDGRAVVGFKDYKGGLTRAIRVSVQNGAEIDLCNYYTQVQHRRTPSVDATALNHGLSALLSDWSNDMFDRLNNQEFLIVLDIGLQYPLDIANGLALVHDLIMRVMVSSEPCKCDLHRPQKRIQGDQAASRRRKQTHTAPASSQR